MIIIILCGSSRFIQFSSSPPPIKKIYIIMTLTQQTITVAALAFSISSCHSFTTSSSITPSSRTIPSLVQTFATVENTASVGNLHGQSACFLPILQNDDEYIAPRIVQVCTIYYLNMVICVCLILFMRGVSRWCHVIVNR